MTRRRPQRHAGQRLFSISDFEAFMNISKILGKAALCTGVLAALILAGCGGGGGDSSSASQTSASTGVFVDSAVAGLTYVSGGTTGKTDSTGAFQYTAGNTVTFKVGDIVLGTVTPKAVITPVTLVSGATDETNATVANIAKFLQTIDDDNNPANGITISAAVNAAAAGKVINFAQTTTAFDADATVLATVAALTTATTAGAHALVTTATAQSHLRSNLLARLVGTYSGTYSGATSGTFSVTINSYGVISGTGVQAGIPFNISGTVASNGTGTFGSAGIATFNGSVNPDTGAFSGTWSSTDGTGTYSGKKQ
jgi:hypothetical protein